MRKRLTIFYIFLLPVLGLAQNGIVVIRNVGVVDVVNGKLKERQTVIIEKNKIIAVSRNPMIPKQATLIDGTGKFLIPGLWDMHIHALTDHRYNWVFPLLVANGVTGVREMGHNLKPNTADSIRQEMANGTRVGPRLGATTASILDGPGTKLNVAIPVATEEEGRQWVRNFKQQGVDFIKPYNLLSRPVYLAIVDECKKQNITFAGHVPFSMTAAEVSELGQRSIEHHTDVVLSCATNEPVVRADLLDSLKLQPVGMVPMIEVRAAAAYDNKKAKRLFTQFIRNDTWLCPTLVLSNSSSQTQMEREGVDRLRYIPKAMQDRWRLQTAQQTQRMQRPEDRILRAQMRLKATTDMIAEGVALLVGTDAPNPYTYPGFSLHDELVILTQCGLSPAAALKAATFDAVRFLGKGRQMGTVENGKLADLVLLDANPLEDIHNTKKIFAVIVNGRLLQRSDLDNLLRQAEEQAKK